VQFGADFGYGIMLLGLWVRERAAMSLEKAVHKLTFEVASVYGIQNRGLLRPGYAADIAIFDPKTSKITNRNGQPTIPAERAGSSSVQKACTR
jgi:N-acyl-D-aspartate/D-glutamate deacylase